MADPLLPDTLLRDRYLIRQIIGRGGMGSIYMAEDNRLPGRRCAVKEVQQDASLPEHIRLQAREQFSQEASVLARLDHPNLPKVSDYFSHAERDYLVMDYVPGDDLRTLMERARLEDRILTEADVLGWADQLADALGYLHSQDPPVIHRDIKPSNLKLTPSGLVKLVDFGLVKQLVPDEMTVTVIQGRGTAQYTPLEQYGADTGHTDPRSDIYAFGATLYHLLTGVAPPEAKQRFLDPRSLRPPREINPNVSPQTEKAILWAVALHPDHRPASIPDFRSALLGNGPAATEPLQFPSLSALVARLHTPLERGLALSAAILLGLALLGTLL